MIPEITEPIQIVAPLVAILVSYVLFYEGIIYNIGSDNGFWRRIRAILPMIDNEARDIGFYTTYEVIEAEHAGKLQMSVLEARALPYSLMSTMGWETLETARAYIGSSDTSAARKLRFKYR